MDSAPHSPGAASVADGTVGNCSKDRCPGIPHPQHTHKHDRFRVFVEQPFKVASTETKMPTSPRPSAGSRRSWRSISPRSGGRSPRTSGRCTPVGKADLHIHTRVSDGMASVSQVLEYVEYRTDLDVVAITDHEDAGGGLRASSRQARLPLRRDRGYRVTTMQGHVIGLFLETTPASFRRVESAIEMIHNQGGLAVAPHPLSWLTRLISSRTLNRLTRQDGPRFDAIELASPSPAALPDAWRAVHLNNEVWRLPAIEFGCTPRPHRDRLGPNSRKQRGRSARAMQADKRPPGCRSTPCESASRDWQQELAWGYSATPRKMLRRRI